MIRIIIDIKYDHVYKYDFECIFDMFASLLDALLQTFIVLLAPVFDASLSVAMILNSFIDEMISYICATICGGIFAREIDAGFALVCVLVMVICVEIRPGLFRCIFYYYTVVACFIFEFIDEPTNGLLHFCDINEFFNAVLSLATTAIRIGLCLTYVSTQQTQGAAITTGIFRIELTASTTIRIIMFRQYLQRLIRIGNTTNTISDNDNSNNYMNLFSRQ